MKKLFKKRLLGIPVAALLILALTAGAIAGGFAVISGTVTVEVKEALTVEYSWDGGTDWVLVEGDFGYTITAYPGECHDFQVRVKNNSSASLLVEVVHTLDAGPDEGGGKVTVTGVGTNAALFDGGICIPGGSTRTGLGMGCVAGDAPEGNYVFSVAVTRNDCTSV